MSRLHLLRVAVVGLILALATNVRAGTPAILHLSNGDRLTGQIVSETPETIVIDHPLVGRVTVARADLISPDAATEPAQASPAEDAADSGRADAPDTPDAPPSPWSGTIGLAGTLNRSVNNSANVRLGVKVTRETDTEVFKATADWFYNQKNGATIDNDVIINAKQDWLIKNSRWLYFVQGTYQFDQFQDWAHRVSPYAGVGYRFIDRDDLSLVGKVGGGLTWEYADRDLEGQLLFEVESSWTIDERQSITGSAQWAPKPTEPADYLLTVKLDYAFKLGTDIPWSIEAGILDIYDSRATGNSNDFKAFVGLALDF